MLTKQPTLDELIGAFVVGINAYKEDVEDDEYQVISDEKLDALDEKGFELDGFANDLDAVVGGFQSKGFDVVMYAKGSDYCVVLLVGEVIVCTAHSFTFEDAAAGIILDMFNMGMF